MGTINFSTMIRTHFTHVDTRRLLSEFIMKTMLKFCTILLASVYTLLLNISARISKYVYREGNGSNFSENYSQKDDEILPKNSTVFLSSGTEDSVLLQKNQFMCSENVIGYFEEPKTENFVVQDTFFGSDEVEICDTGVSLEESLSEHQPESCSSFYFKLLSDSYLITQEHVDHNIGQERRENLIKTEQAYEEEQKQDFEDEILEDKDVSYQVEFLEKQESLQVTSKLEDLEDEYIELDQDKIMKSVDSWEESKNCWDLNLIDSDSDEDEKDALLEHQNLVQQMKVELKNCRIRGLPTISEDCESPKMLEDLKPLKIDHKIEYKDVMKEIHKFYKSYMDKMKRLDILNYQTLHAISFLKLKESEVFAAGAGKKKGDSISSSTSPKIWPYKQRVFADPMHKCIMEMHRDLELVYVGQLCLSWETLCWLHVKSRELLQYDSCGNHSYNRAAEEFQQFQVLLQRFIEDELLFQGRRIQNYVKSRCTLLQVPLVKDDCLKAKKEIREERDAIALELLIEIIKESMVIFRDFVFADKKAVVLKGTKCDDLQEDPGNSKLLMDIITNLHKKERKIKEHVSSQNCILKKMKKHKHKHKDKGGCLDNEVLKSQIELRLVSRVMSLSRLTTDQLVWCNNKLNNINIVSGNRIHVEPSFLLFPC